MTKVDYTKYIVDGPMPINGQRIKAVDNTPSDIQDKPPPKGKCWLDQQCDLPRREPNFGTVEDE